MSYEKGYEWTAAIAVFRKSSHAQCSPKTKGTASRAIITTSLFLTTESRNVGWMQETWWTLWHPWMVRKVNTEQGNAETPSLNKAAY